MNEVDRLLRFHLKIEDCATGEPLGESLSVIAEGEYDGGVLTLHYSYDGAGYRLIVEEGCVKSLRLGDTEITLEFRPGQETLGTLKGGGTAGNFSIFTHELKIKLTPNGCCVRVTYSDGGENSGKVVKNITAYAVG